MKISKIFYLSLLIISLSLIIAYCLKIIFFPSNNKTLASTNNYVPETNSKSIFETNTKYLNDVYLEYKKISHKKKFLLTEKQFSNIFLCFFVLSQLEVVDYGEMIIYILEKNPILLENLLLKSGNNFKGGIFGLLKINNVLFYKNPLHQEEDQSVEKKFEDLKLKIRKHYKDLGTSTSLNNFNELRNDIKAIFNTTLLNYQHLQKPLTLFDICITNGEIFIEDNILFMKSALFYAIDYIKRNWTDNLSTDIQNDVFSFEFTTPEGNFSYFYISLYSWIYFRYDD